MVASGTWSVGKHGHSGNMVPHRTWSYDNMVLGETWSYIMVDSAQCLPCPLCALLPTSASACVFQCRQAPQTHTMFLRSYLSDIMARVGV